MIKSLFRRWRLFDRVAAGKGRFDHFVGDFFFGVRFFNERFGSAVGTFFSLADLFFRRVHERSAQAADDGQKIRILGRVRFEPPAVGVRKERSALRRDSVNGPPFEVQRSSGRLRRFRFQRRSHGEFGFAVRAAEFRPDLRFVGVLQRVAQGTVNGEFFLFRRNVFGRLTLRRLIIGVHAINAVRVDLSFRRRIDRSALSMEPGEIIVFRREFFPRHRHHRAAVGAFDGCSDITFAHRDFRSAQGAIDLGEREPVGHLSRVPRKGIHAVELAGGGRSPVRVAFVRNRQLLIAGRTIDLSSAKTRLDLQSVCAARTAEPDIFRRF